MTKKIGKTEKFTVVDYEKIDELAHKKYKLKNFSFIRNQECGNDSWHFFDVLGGFRSREEWIRGAYKSKNIGNIDFIDLLALDGVIPKGKYLIHVCW